MALLTGLFFKNIWKILIELVLKTEKRVLGKKDCEEFLTKTNSFFHVHLKLQIYSSPWSVAYEGQRAMELKARLAIDIIFDIAKAFLSLYKFA